MQIPQLQSGQSVHLKQSDHSSLLDWSVHSLLWIEYQRMLTEKGRH